MRIPYNSIMLYLQTLMHQHSALKHRSKGAMAVPGDQAPPPTPTPVRCICIKHQLPPLPSVGLKISTSRALLIYPFTEITSYAGHRMLQFGFL